MDDKIEKKIGYGPRIEALIQLFKIKEDEEDIKKAVFEHGIYRTKIGLNEASATLDELSLSYKDFVDRKVNTLKAFHKDFHTYLDAPEFTGIRIYRKQGILRIGSTIIFPVYFLNW